MPRDGVYWSSSVGRRFLMIWTWDAKVYRNEEDQDIKNKGFAFNRRNAEFKRDCWLAEMGEVP